jgi:hypothetical protein
MRYASIWLGVRVLLVLSVVSCQRREGVGPVPPYLTMLTTEASYEAGDVATVRLVNHSHEPLLYYGCDVVLDVLTTSGWRRAPMASLPCIDRLVGIGPRSEGTMQLLLPDETVAGVYRVRFERIRVAGKYEASDAIVPYEQLTTNVFAVQ